MLDELSAKKAASVGRCASRFWSKSLFLDEADSANLLFPCLNVEDRPVNRFDASNSVPRRPPEEPKK